MHIDVRVAQTRLELAAAVADKSETIAQSTHILHILVLMVMARALQYFRSLVWGRRNGYEAYRQLGASFEPRSTARQTALLQQVLNPTLSS